MSRWSPRNNKKKYSEKGGSTIWINKPKKLYKVTTDQGTFFKECENLDFKGTVANFRKHGYTNINIICLGYEVTWKAF